MAVGSRSRQSLPRIPGLSRAAEETCKGKRRQRKGVEVRGRILFHPFRSFTRFLMHGNGIATVVPPPVAAASPGPGQTQSRLSPSSTGPKTTPNAFTMLRGHRRRDTQECGMLPREFAHEFPAESEDSVFHPQRTPADAGQKPSREAGHGHGIHPGDPPSSGAPTDAGRDARSHPHHRPRDSLKREEMPPGLERALISVRHLASL